MKTTEKKSKEPYPAEKTPTPPQVMNPEVRKEKEEGDKKKGKKS